MVDGDDGIVHSFLFESSFPTFLSLLILKEEIFYFEPFEAVVFVQFV